MKLRLPSILLSALVAAQMCTTATADTVVGSGHFYDVGKYSYASPATTYLRADGTSQNDALLCWANSSSNITQYWQDFYYKNAEAGTPNGTVNTGLSPYGTGYLAVYNAMCEKIDEDKGGDASGFLTWWFTGNEYADTLFAGTAAEKKVVRLEAMDKANYSAFETAASAYKSMSTTNISGDGWETFIKESLAVPGQAIAMAIEGNATHSISMWGYETDSEGHITSLMLTDSDDQQFGLYRMDVVKEDVYGDFSQYWGPGYEHVYQGTKLVLKTDDDFCYYGHGKDTLVSSLVTTQVPEAYSLSAEDTPKVKTTIAADGAVSENTNLANDTHETSVSGKGVTVGDGKSVVVLTAEQGHTLSLEGNGVAETGLLVEQGGSVILSNISIDGYKDGGMETGNKTYFNDGSVSITNNEKSTGNGAGINTTEYLEMRNGEVAITGNKAANGMGGGIYTTDRMVIRGNSSVEFSGNEASQGGNDIYNAKGGTVIVADNASVTFASSENGKAAVTNDGTLYLANNDDQEIVFDHSSLNGSGITYIGKDNNSSSYNGAVTFKGDGDDAMTVAKKTATVAAALQDLSVSLNEINGSTASQSFISGAAVNTNGDLNVSKLTMDNTSALSADGAITLNAVVIDLKGVEGAVDGDIITYDLSGLLTASTGVTMNNLVFDTNGLELTDGQQVVVTLGNTLAGTALLLTSDGLREQTKLLDGSVHFNASSPIVPEPATTTLSLLALAGLCARRRRH